MTSTNQLLHRYVVFAFLIVFIKAYYRGNVRIGQKVTIRKDIIFINKANNLREISYLDEGYYLSRIWEKIRPKKATDVKMNTIAQNSNSVSQVTNELILDTFQNDNTTLSDQSTILRRDLDQTSNNLAYIPKGMLGHTGRVVRRRFLNLFDRTKAQPWAGSVCAEDDLSCTNTGILVTSTRSDNNVDPLSSTTVVLLQPEETAKRGRLRKIFGYLFGTITGVFKADALEYDYLLPTSVATSLAIATTSGDPKTAYLNDKSRRIFRAPNKAVTTSTDKRNSSGAASKLATIAWTIVSAVKYIDFTTYYADLLYQNDDTAVDTNSNHTNNQFDFNTTALGDLTYSLPECTSSTASNNATSNMHASVNNNSNAVILVRSLNNLVVAGKETVLETGTTIQAGLAGLRSSSTRYVLSKLSFGAVAAGKPQSESKDSSCSPLEEASSLVTPKLGIFSAAELQKHVNLEELQRLAGLETVGAPLHAINDTAPEQSGRGKGIVRNTIGTATRWVGSLIGGAEQHSESSGVLEMLPGQPLTGDAAGASKSSDVTVYTEQVPSSTTDIPQPNPSSFIRMMNYVPNPWQNAASRDALSTQDQNSLQLIRSTALISQAQRNPTTDDTSVEYMVAEIKRLREVERNSIKKASPAAMGNSSASSGGSSGSSSRTSWSSSRNNINNSAITSSVGNSVDVIGAQAMQPMLAVDSIPVPTKADFAYIASRRTEMALQAALSISSEAIAKEFIKHIGTGPLVAALLGKVPLVATITRVDAVRALYRLIKFDKAVGVEVVAIPGVVAVLADMLEAPLKGFKTLQSQAERDRNLKAQAEATSLIHLLVRSSDLAVESLRSNERLRKILQTVAGFDAAPATTVTANTWATDLLAELNVTESKSAKQLQLQQQQNKARKVTNTTTVAEYANLKSSQMARVASWGLGGVPWRPRTPGQKGLRILSLDGGGTRGVLSIAFLREIMKRVDRNLEPHQMFDIICGTSTGGIIAVLLGAQRASLTDAETLYDSFIDKIFGQKSNLRLVTEQAAYDGRDWENILYDMCGDKLLLDSNQEECPRVFCVSTKVNVNPALPKLWRNYNYPPGQSSRYPGTCRVNTYTAIRATTAAPTFFTPVKWEDGLFCDGAIVANNPTAIALQEAKVLYPNVPIELVVSLGTGYMTTKSSIQSMGWDLLVNQLIASSTGTEDVHALLGDFLPKDKYYRFNPLLPDLLRIDEKNKSVLTGLKTLAKESIKTIETGPGAKDFAQLIKTLRGPK